MKIFDMQRGVGQLFFNKVAVLLIVSLLLWAFGAPSFRFTANAAAFTNISDTLSDSDLSVSSAHTLRFTVNTALDTAGGSDTIFIHFDPTGNAFNLLNVGADTIGSEIGMDVVSACGVGASEFQAATTSDTLTLTLCSGDTVATSTILSFKTGTTTITNPGTAASYVIRVTSRDQGNASLTLDTADTRVAIIDDVVVTAAVDTSFTFTVAGLASGTTVNGTTTSTTTTATAIGYGTLQPGVPVFAGQRLSV
ncbi:MAG: hypothetical protein RIQ56_101, partial [Candidatus Parcubacteria bacterium]